MCPILLIRLDADATSLVPAYVALYQFDYASDMSIVGLSQPADLHGGGSGIPYFGDLGVVDAEETGVY